MKVKNQGAASLEQINGWEEIKAVADTIRGLSMDAIQKANSGHPGLPMGMADTAALLWSHYLKFDPQHPKWPNRDRFILSAGHGSMLLYSLLHLSGYDISLDDIKNFRQWQSLTPGHPEYAHTPGVETTTGPLGQGLANAVGMAISERWQAERFNKPDYAVVDHNTFVIVGDGDLMEGISHEACSLAGHLGLGRLIVLFDDNQICIDGSTSLTTSDNVLARFESYGWQVSRVDGHNLSEVAVALNGTIKNENRPSIIACRTVIGFGSPNRAGTAKAHGEPLGEEEIKLVKAGMGWPEDETFRVLPAAREILKTAAKNGNDKRVAWQEMFSNYSAAYPELAEEYQRSLRGEFPSGWEKQLPDFAQEQPLASRAASGKTLNTLMDTIPNLIGGSADLTGSNKTNPGKEKSVQSDDFSGRYIHFGIREHAMGAIMNGMALYGGIIPFGGTFLVFSDYMRPSIRLAAMMNLGVIYVFTHDSIGLGEDGPTHQPIEHLAALRTIPNLAVIRPADSQETADAWKVAMQRRSAPTALIFSRQKLPNLNQGDSTGLDKGAYILADADDLQVILMATGSEVQLAVAAHKLLAEKGIGARVVSMPSCELFEAMPQEYQDEILPPEISARVAVEAASPIGWHRYIGREGIFIGLDRFGASAPYETLYRELGITAEAIVAAAESLISK